jgi:hypothetical protein
VSAGTFTSGHVGPDAVAGLLALHEPGAVCAWVIAGALWPAFEPVVAALRIQRVHVALEPIRAGGPPEAVMFVGRWPEGE